MDIDPTNPALIGLALFGKAVSLWLPAYLIIGAIYHLWRGMRPVGPAKGELIRALLEASAIYWAPVLAAAVTAFFALSILGTPEGPTRIATSLLIVMMLASVLSIRGALKAMRILKRLSLREKTTNG